MLNVPHGPGEENGGPIWAASREDTQPIALQTPPVDGVAAAARAVAELRRGAAILVVSSTGILGCAAAETAREGLDDLLRWAAIGTGSAHGVQLLRPDTGEDRPSGAAAPRLVRYILNEDELTQPALAACADPAFAAPSQRRSEGLAGGPDVDAAIMSAAAAAIVLTKLAYLLPSVVVVPVAEATLAIARAAGTVVVTAADAGILKQMTARLLRVGEARVPLEDAADARLVAFRNPDTGVEHVAIVIGTPEGDGTSAQTQAPPLVRLHSECFTGDVLGSLRCDCGPQLRGALRRMAEEGRGVLLYLAQEGRGIGLLNKLRSYVLQDRGLDTLDANAALGFAADERDFAIAASMLRELGLSRIRLLTNNPDKVRALAACGIVVERASLLIAPNGVNDGYLATKASRFGHLLT